MGGAWVRYLVPTTPAIWRGSIAAHFFGIAHDRLWPRHSGIVKGTGSADGLV